MSPMNSRCGLYISTPDFNDSQISVENRARHAGAQPGPWTAARGGALSEALSDCYTRTGLGELSHQLRPQPYLPEDMPRGFVRLVYCLGYGENGLLERPVIGSPNRGTPQFGKIFYSCINLVSSNADFAPVQRGRTTPGAVKPSPRTMKAVLLKSWDAYVGPLVEESHPEAVLCIGRGVAGLLGSRIQELGTPWGAVPQPNARLASDVHLDTFEAYYHASRDPGILAAGR